MLLESRCPHVYRWFKMIRDDPKLSSALTPISAYKLWIDELMTVPMGKKPALRLPMKL